MGATIAIRNAQLDLINGTSMSLHTADPGNTGANEVSGGSPAYARKTIAWNAASGANKTRTATTITFDVPSGATISHFGIWSGSTFQAWFALPASIAYSSQGTYVVPAGLTLWAA